MTCLRPQSTQNSDFGPVVHTACVGKPSPGVSRTPPDKPTSDAATVPTAVRCALIAVLQLLLLRGHIPSSSSKATRHGVVCAQKKDWRLGRALAR